MPGADAPGAALGVLSIGYARGLWGPPDAEDVRRLSAYGRGLRRYAHLIHAHPRHGLEPLRIAGVLEAYPTGARTPAGSFARMLRMGAALLREGGFSLVQAQDPVFTGAAALLLGRRFGLPVNVCVYGSDVFDPHWRRAQWSNAASAPVGRAVLRRADGVQVDGLAAARSLAAAGIDPARIRVKPMIPANLDAFLALPPARGGEGSARLLFVGRLAVQKNLPLLAEVLARVAAAGGEVELHVVGAGPEEARFRRLLAGGAGRAVFHGALPREAVVAAFARADALVLTSHYEGNPRVMMEAAAAGLPIVTTAVGGADEWVRDGDSGFVVPVGDGEAHADRVLRLARDPALRARMGAAARALAAARVAGGADAGAQVRIWRELVERHAAGRPGGRG